MTELDHPLAGLPTVACRWCSDAVPFVWCLTKGAKRIPIEPTPNPAGNVEVTPADHPGAAPFAIVHKGPPGMLDTWVAYMPHHATCARDKEVTTP